MVQERERVLFFSCVVCLAEFTIKCLALRVTLNKNNTLIIY